LSFNTTPFRKAAPQGGLKGLPVIPFGGSATIILSARKVFDFASRHTATNGRKRQVCPVPQAAGMFLWQQKHKLATY